MKGSFDPVGVTACRLRTTDVERGIMQTEEMIPRQRKSDTLLKSLAIETSDRKGGTALEQNVGTEPAVYVCVRLQNTSCGFYYI